MAAKWSELFPYGRRVFYEGKDPKGFAKEILKTYKFEIRFSGVYNKPNGYQFHCPAKLLDEIYGSGKYPLGS